MANVLNYDGFLLQLLNKIMNCVWLSILWVVFSIPLITIGASTTALYYTANKVIRNDRSHVWREFFYSFKSNFKQATSVWVILIFLFVFWAVDTYFTYAFYLTGIVPNFVVILFGVLGVLIMAWGLYLFPYTARFQNTIKEIIMNSGMMFVQNFFWSLLLLLIFVLTVFIFLTEPMLIFVLPVGYMMLQGFILERIFRKYMSPEDLAAEKIRNCSAEDIVEMSDES